MVGGAPRRGPGAVHRIGAYLARARGFILLTYSCGEAAVNGRR